MCQTIRAILRRASRKRLVKIDYKLQWIKREKEKKMRCRLVKKKTESNGWTRLSEKAKEQNRSHNACIDDRNAYTNAHTSQRKLATFRNQKDEMFVHVTAFVWFMVESNWNSCANASAVGRKTDGSEGTSLQEKKNKLCQMPWPAVQSFPVHMSIDEASPTSTMLTCTHTHTHPASTIHNTVIRYWALLMDRYCDFVIIKFRWKMSYVCQILTLNVKWQVFWLDLLIK